MIEQHEGARVGIPERDGASSPSRPQDTSHDGDMLTAFLHMWKEHTITKVGWRVVFSRYSHAGGTVGYKHPG